jgi:hypothetical protein
MPITILNSILAAIRTGALYERRGSREIAVLSANQLTAELLDLIQTFRGRIYRLGGAIAAVQNGRHSHPADAKSDHILLLEDGKLIGCARYEYSREHLERSVIELGGFVVDPLLRNGRATLAIVQKVKQHALLRGDRHFLARASVEFGSASILKKFGARVIEKYFDPAYQRNVESLEILLDELPTSRQLAA